MQVFVPSTDLKLSAWSLDISRAGNQCWRESVTLYKGGWPNHPASRMFKGHEKAFAEYNMYIMDAAEFRDWYSPSTREKWRTYWKDIYFETSDTGLPDWWGDESVHSSHRAALLYKNPKWYSKLGWTEEPVIDYCWPE